MSDPFIRTGDLLDLAGYPPWARDLPEACASAKPRRLRAGDADRAYAPRSA